MGKREINAGNMQIGECQVARGVRRERRSQR